MAKALWGVCSTCYQLIIYLEKNRGKYGEYFCDDCARKKGINKDAKVESRKDISQSEKGEEMGPIDQYTDQELRDELERRKHLWNVYEQRIRDGHIAKINRLVNLDYYEALREVENANAGPRGDTWRHFILPINLEPKKVEGQ